MERMSGLRSDRKPLDPSVGICNRNIRRLIIVAVIIGSTSLYLPSRLESRTMIIQDTNRPFATALASRCCSR